MTNNIIGQHFINNQFVSQRADFASLNPCNNEPIGCFPNATKEEVKLAVDFARAAFPAWKATSRVKRAEYFDNLCQVIKKKSELLTHVISLETGKNLNESTAEVNELLHMAMLCFGKGRESCGEVFSSELSERDCYVIRKPKGVIGIITPWNFPAAINLWNSGPAILEGNTVVCKPSELTPYLGQLIVELYLEAGFPAGVFNLIHGDGQAGQYLVESDIDHVSFTGSVQTGQTIRKICADSLNKTCSCELGSKSAVIVFDDGNLALAVNACISSAFKLSGQRCVSSGRLFIQESVFEDFKNYFLKEVENLTVGDPFVAANHFFGPLISLKQANRVREYNKMAREDKDVVVLFDSPETSDCFVKPFVYTCLWSDKRFLKEEVFGPHVALIPFKTLDEVVDYYNDTKYGLSLGVITSDFKKMREMRDRCDCGLFYANLGSVAAESHMPFGGVKASGNGYASAAGSFDAFVNKMAVSINHGDALTFPQGMK